MTSTTIAPHDLFALQFVRDGRIAPDGKRVAYVISRTLENDNTERCEVRVRELDSGRESLIEAACNVATSLRWSPDSTHLVFVSNTPTGSRVCLASTLTGQIRALTPSYRLVEGAPTWSPDGTRVAVCVTLAPAAADPERVTTRVYRRDGQGRIEGLQAAICLIDVVDGRSVELTSGPDLYSAPKWSPRGDMILVLTTSSRTLGMGHFPRLCLLDVATGQLRETLKEPWAIEAAEWCPDGRRIVAAGSCGSREGVPAAALWVLDSDGTHIERRTDDRVAHIGFRYHHDMPVWEAHRAISVPSDDFALATVQSGERSSICRIALSGDLACEELVGGDRSCVILDAWLLERQVLYWTTAFERPSELCIARWDDPNSERALTDLNSVAMSRWPTMRVEHLRFTSADGLPLEGWFMARRDATGPQPTILFIHGGPYNAIGRVFRFDFWMLAASGYAVLFANFRGSIGYGASFSLAIDPDWGARGFPDHMAAVDAAVARGLADPRRLGVWGASHGGFATTWIVGHTNRFRAAVAEASLPDFSLAYYLSDLPDFFAQLLGGTPREAPDVYRERSPLTYAHRCTTPTLLLHGDADARCPLAGAESFYRALLDAGCISELVTLKECDHMGDSCGPLSVRLGQNVALLSWFQRHLQNEST